MCRGSFGKQKCCYDANGNLVTGPPSGGYQLKNVEMSSFNWRRFFDNDIAPFIGCCIASTEHCLNIYYTRRPSDNCNSFSVRQAGRPIPKANDTYMLNLL